ncbi:MAG: CoA transferase [Alphaproteobacteria bacterium]|nr:CoA transferase [Alphaproteobacteria bacterium]MDP6812331.1 CoA transferase [Alphaproteobacteria bacterium]
MSQVLEGVRVLDFGRYIAGPFCGTMLADLGADVIRIEKIDGSEDRYTMPVGEGAEGEYNVGAMFQQINRNKRGMTLNPMKPEGREIVKQLVATADVVIANLPAQTLETMGLDYASLRAIKSDIILTTVSAFGSTGPYKDRVGFDGVAAAMSGMMHLSGYADEPMKAHTPWVDFGTASAATIGTLAALIERRKSGEGQVVEGTLLGTALAFNNGSLIEQAVIETNRVGTGNRGQTSAPSDAFECQDGWIIVQVVGQPLFERWARLMGENHWLSDERFKDDICRGDNAVEISERMQRWCAERTREDAIRALEEARIPVGHVYAPAETLTDPHVREAGFLKEIQYPGTPRPAPLVDLHVRLSGTPGGVRHRAPTLGEHTAAIMHELGYADDDIAALREKRVV